MSAERVAGLNEFFRDRVPGLFGLEITKCDDTGCEGRLTVTEALIAGTGFLFAPVVVGVADILSAFSVSDHLPEGSSFTTVELKTNFFASAKVGEVVVGEAHAVHVGRTTIVCDATITNETTGRTMAMFRNTQLVLSPR
jgi:1,4-dihydroxy-2-naphthoyl-CoA hydrolase